MGLIDMMTSLTPWVAAHRLLEFYPPFFFIGAKVVHVSKDYRELRVRVPLRWYGRNLNGTMFGGFLCAISDPLPALMCDKIFPGHEVWTKSNYVDFLRPAKGVVELSIVISEADVAVIAASLREKGKATHSFEFSYRDRKDHEIARVRNAVYLRRRK